MCIFLPASPQHQLSRGKSEHPCVSLALQQARSHSAAGGLEALLALLGEVSFVLFSVCWKVLGGSGTRQ